MKKTLLATALLMATGSAYAAKDAGCGLGAQLWAEKEGIAPNVMAATTNGTSGNQTFGMSTGTLGCDNSKSRGFMAVNEYMDSNMDKVARDMSRGHGEALDALAKIMGVADADKANFFSVSKANFEQIFTSETVNRSEVVANLAKVLQTDATLAKYAPQA